MRPERGNMVATTARRAPSAETRRCRAWTSGHAKGAEIAAPKFLRTLRPSRLGPCPFQLRTHTDRETAAKMLGLDFEIVGELTDVEMIAAGRGIRDLARLRRLLASAIGGR